MRHAPTIVSVAMIATKEKNKMTEQNTSRKTFDVLDEEGNIIGEETAVDSTEANNSKKVADALNGDGRTATILKGLNDLCVIRCEAGRNDNIDEQVQKLDDIKEAVRKALFNAMMAGSALKKYGYGADEDYYLKSVDARAELIDLLEDND